MGIQKLKDKENDVLFADGFEMYFCFTQIR